ncbi:MAG: hypothetical protein AABX03_04485 [Nanoarchaeota archaeon]
MNPKHAFWQALFVTIIIFFLGIIIGFFLESFRSDKLGTTLINSEINLLDQQLRENVIGNFNVSCNQAVNSSFVFADKIYSEARRLEDFDQSSKFTETLFLLHKRYDLLRMMLWTESIKIKNQCKSTHNFHTVVYLYEYNTKEIDQVSKQKFFSRALSELKDKYPDKVLLIPIAADMDLESVNLAVNKYGIEKYPVIIIDEKKVIDNVITSEQLEKDVFSS